MIGLFRKYSGSTILWGLLFLQSCQPEGTIPKDDSQYAPVDVGRYWIYEIREEHYSLSAAPVFSTYFLKEAIGEPGLSAQTDKTYKLIRYKRSRSTDSWKTDSVWTVQQWPNRLMRTENSIAVIRLLFPIVVSTAWNQNEYNSLPASSCRYEQIGNAYIANGKNFANTIQVVNKQNDSTAISLNRQVDVYAYQTGLIAKENTALAYCQSTPDCIGKGQIAYGYRRKQTLIETGVD
ncbi:hypothetical protein [Spirosoma gilvum]